MNEWLMASGPTTLSLLVEFPGYEFGNEGGLTCLIAVDGISQSCGGIVLLENGVPGSEVSFTTDSDVPFSLELQIGRYALAEGQTGGSTVTYSLDASGLTVLTPEPSSICLLIPGLAGIFLSAKSRIRLTKSGAS
jgi:hypothetical protein